MLQQFRARLRRPYISIYGRPTKGIDMESAELDDFQIGGGRLGQLNGCVCFQAKNISRAHRASEINEKPWIGSLKFHKARSKPERAKSFRDRNPDLAGQAGHCTIACAHKTE